MKNEMDKIEKFIASERLKFLVYRLIATPNGLLRQVLIKQKMDEVINTYVYRNTY